MDAQEILAEGLRASRAYRDYEQPSPAATVMANALAALSTQPNGPTVAWEADDTEMCLFCTWPESSTVVLRIGLTITVCEAHIWRGLLAKLGPHPRENQGFPQTEEA